jgi:hypothetical protein
VVLAGAAALFATYWDDAWHTDLGRDSPTIPPHLLLYASVAVIGAVVVARAWRRCGARGRRRRSCGSRRCSWPPQARR